MDGLVAEFVRAVPGAPPGEAQEVAGDLIRRWQEPHRHYHTLRHLIAMLSTVDGASGPPDVVLACWFHDAIYDPRRAGNEEASADLAVAALDSLGVDGTEVARLVRLTATHDPDPGDHSGQLLCDADLAILAAPAGEYAEYAANVRREYAHVPDDEFRIGRAAVLESLLDLPALFHLDTHRIEWEKRARANMDNELSVLTDAV
jgi:predicted metal-dependent HD superfamily phosphohydrolase